MAKAKPVGDSDGEQIGYVVQCPGCGHEHLFNVEQPGPRGQQWSFNGDVDTPTFAPSLVVRSGHYATGQTEHECGFCNRERAGGSKSPCMQCHSFVREGRIEFLNDCTHELAGQTVELPEVED